VWLAEYHFSAISVLSSPITIASAIAAGPNASALAWRWCSCPWPIRSTSPRTSHVGHTSVRVGVEFGVGRGTFPDTHDGFNSPFAESRERFDEYLEIVVKAWTQERFSSRANTIGATTCGCGPSRYRASPPIRVGINLGSHLSPRRTPGNSAFIINPSGCSALSELAPHIKQYREAWHAAGHAGLLRWGFGCRSTWPRTAERAYAEPRASTMAAMQGLGNRVADSASRGHHRRLERSGRNTVRNMTYDDWLRDKVVYGTPEKVVDRLRQLRDELDLTQILYEVNHGRQLPYALQLENLKLINERVIPQLK